MITRIKIIQCILGVFIFLKSESQNIPANLKVYISDNETKLSQTHPFYSDVKKFYTYHNYQFAWLNSGQESLNALLELIKNSTQLGLNEKDYSIELPGDGGERIGINEDSIAREIQITNAALHFFHDVIYGNSIPHVGYNGLNYRPDCFDVPILLSSYLKTGGLHLLIKDIQPQNRQYQSILERINRLENIIKQNDFNETPVISLSATITNLPLLNRLYQLNITDSVKKKLNAEQLSKNIKEAQKLFGYTPDGILRKVFLKELNVPIETRIEELKLALNTIRWLTCILNTPTIIVNIPSASLQVYKEGKLIFNSRVIVGKKTTQTPTLISKANEVVAYPYWVVPYSIAVKELLPIIKRNASYLNSNGYQVLNKNGKIVSPASVNWSSLSPGKFPYTIRQSTGCDNALGLVKLNFYNPYSVYLHDTPTKSLFKRNKRYYSHGCMRVEKAMELAHFLLEGNTIAVDTLEEKGCLKSQLPVIIPATQPMNVLVLYNTAWFNEADEFAFSEDIYQRNPFLFRKTVTTDQIRK